MVGRAIDQAVAGRSAGPILRNSRGPEDGRARRHARKNLDRHANYSLAAFMAVAPDHHRRALRVMSMSASSRCDTLKWLPVADAEGSTC